MRNRKYYPTLHDLLASTYAGSLASNLFTSIHWFDGTLTYTDYDNQTQYYPNLGFTPADLYAYWSLMFEELRIGYPCKCSNPFNGPSAAEWTECATNFVAKAQQWLKLNENKFLGLVKTYGYKYDPISNYDMVEVEGSALKQSDEETKNSIKGKIITDVDAPETQVQNYTTTYDDASNSRLAGRSTNEYLDTYRKEVVDGNDIPIKRTSQSMEGADAGQTSTSKFIDANQSLQWDEITTPASNRAQARKLVRRGNIGVMTSQEMIEAERELARQNIIEEFFKEFNKGTMGSW